MFVLITYDVNITSPHGEKRLRNAARACLNYGKRVQNSVFECILTEAQFVMLRNQLKDIIDSELDSIRFYIHIKRCCSSFFISFVRFRKIIIFAL